MIVKDISDTSHLVAFTRRAMKTALLWILLNLKSWMDQSYVLWRTLLRAWNTLKGGCLWECRCLKWVKQVFWTLSRLILYEWLCGCTSSLGQSPQRAFIFLVHALVNFKNREYESGRWKTLMVPAIIVIYNVSLNFMNFFDKFRSFSATMQREQGYPRS